MTDEELINLIIETYANDGKPFENDDKIKIWEDLQNLCLENIQRKFIIKTAVEKQIIRASVFNTITKSGRV